MMGEFGRRVLRRLIFTTALTGLYAWADYRINGEDSGVGIIKKVYRMRKNAQIKKDKEGEVVFVLHQDDYTVV